MKDLSVIIKTVSEISSLLSRSPSCSCVLEDAMELMVVNLDLLYAGTLISYNEGKMFKELAGNSKKINTKCKCKELIAHHWEKAVITNDIIIEHDEKTFVYLPIWIHNNKAGSLCLITNKCIVYSNEFVLMLAIISNHIGQALERELGKERTRYYETLFKAVLGSMTEGIVLFSSGQVIYINEVAKKIIRCKADNLSEQEVREKICELAVNKNKVETYLEASEQIQDTYYFDIESKEGNFFRVRIFLIADQTSDNKGFLISDITKQKLSEKMKDNLLSTVSHELKTPLTTIKGNLSALMREDVIWQEVEKGAFIKDTYTESIRLQSLIEKLLDMSRISAGELKLNKEHIKISQIKEKLEQQLKKSNYVSVGSNIIVWEGLNLDKKIEIDELRILQVLLNIIDNSIIHGFEQKISESKDEKIVIRVLEKNSNIVFSVSDNGRGIDTEHLKKIFNRHYQVQETAFKLGSGLGLNICKGFVEAHHGRIWAESNDGQGSTIYFTIPC